MAKALDTASWATLELALGRGTGGACPAGVAACHGPAATSAPTTCARPWSVPSATCWRWSRRNRPPARPTPKPLPVPGPPQAGDIRLDTPTSHPQVPEVPAAPGGPGAAKQASAPGAGGPRRAVPWPSCRPTLPNCSPGTRAPSSRSPGRSSSDEHGPTVEAAGRLNLATVTQYLSSQKSLAASLTGDGRRQAVLLRSRPGGTAGRAAGVGRGPHRPRRRGPVGSRRPRTRPRASRRRTGGMKGRATWQRPGPRRPHRPRGRATSTRRSWPGSTRQRVSHLDSWDVVREAFGAGRVDPRLRDDNWAAEALAGRRPAGRLAPVGRRLAVPPHGPDQRWPSDGWGWDRMPTQLTERGRAGERRHRRAHPLRLVPHALPPRTVPGAAGPERWGLRPSSPRRTRPGPSARAAVRPGRGRARSGRGRLRPGVRGPVAARRAGCRRLPGPRARRAMVRGASHLRPVNSSTCSPLPSLRQRGVRPGSAGDRRARSRRQRAGR